MNEWIVRAEKLAHLRQRPAELHLFIFRVDRRGGKELLFDLGQARIGELGQALRIGVRAFFGTAYQLPRVAEIAARKGPRALDDRILRLDVAIGALGLAYRIPRPPHPRLERRPRSDKAAQIAFFLPLPPHQCRGAQRLQLPPASLLAVSS